MLEILAVHNEERELHIVELIKTVIEKYSLPLFTNLIHIETTAVPHAKPILTLNVYYGDNEWKNVEVFVHEQFHRFATDNIRYEACITYLKEKYLDLGDCDKTGTYPNSFWEHLIVCRNTRNVLSHIYDDTIINQEIYSGRQAYPLTEMFVKEHFEKIRGDLYKFDMIYDYTLPL